MAATADGVSVLNIPKKLKINTSSPMSCLQSMGLIDQVTVGSEMEVHDMLEKIKDNDAASTAAIWTRVGGVKLACLTDTNKIEPLPLTAEQRKLVVCKDVLAVASQLG